MQTLFTYLMDQSTESKAVNSFDCGEHPNVLVKTGLDISLLTADPSIIQDMLVTKNALIDKTGIFEGIFKNFYLNAFVFSKNDERWKAKRKATAHAFYKDKTVHMLDVLKMYIKRPQDKWLAEIEASPTASTKIDIGKEFLYIFQKFFLHIVFGADLDSLLVKIMEQQGEGTSIFKAKELGLSEAIEETF